MTSRQCWGGWLAYMERDPNHGSSDFIRGPRMGPLQVEADHAPGSDGINGESP